ncbi:MAG: TonB-dependent receptor [Verrucomicrobiaceae bacterium]|nr:MAG: TonB-dependent receptor [Verrucomicrobiaceae bacterium]
MRSLHVFAKISCVLVPMAQPAFAQTAEVQSSSTQAEGEIVVTAQRRAENIQRVPVAITAVNAATLRNASIKSALDLPRVAPGLNVQRTSRQSSLRLNIRGIGTFGSSALESSVAPFIDEVYVPRPGVVVASMLDMEGVEVLRGPQGTLYGRNASVGAVNFRTAAPSEELGGYAYGEIGSGDRLRVEGAVNLPLSDEVQVRVAGLNERFAGLYRNLTNNRQVGSNNTLGGRFSLHAALSDRLQTTFRAEYFKIDGDGLTNYDIIPGTIKPGGIESWKTFIGPILPDMNTFDRNFRISDDGAVARDRQLGISNTSALSLDGGYELRLISGYRDYKSLVGIPTVFEAPYPILTNNLQYNSKSHSEEFQIVSPKNELLGGRLDFVAGLYYFRDKLFINEAQRVYDTFCNIFVSRLAPTLTAGCLSAPQGQGSNLAFRQKTTSFAAYGQANVRVVDALTLVVGGRATHDRKAGSVTQVVTNPGAALLIGPENTPNLRIRDTRPSWRFGLNWQAMSNTLIYASYSTGFKSGGFSSGGATRALGVSRVFQPETSKSYEMGFKTSLFDRRLTLNGAAYIMDIGGLQDRSWNGLTYIISNAGSLRNKGIELETKFTPVQGLSVNFGGAYLHSEFTDYPNGPNLPGLPGVRDLKGERPSHTPKWTGNLGVEYRSDIGATGLSFMVRSDVRYQSDTNVGTINDANPQLFQSSYAVVTSRATLYGRDERWSLSIFGDNLFNKGYCLGKGYWPFSGVLGLSTPGNSAIQCNVAGPPRTLGAQISVKY